MQHRLHRLARRAPQHVALPAAPAQSRARGGVALAVDSRWHECVHELTHMAFHTRVRTAAAGAPAAAEEPLRRHWEQLRARGLSDEIGRAHV